MKTGKNLQELCETLMAQSAAKKDYLVDTRTVRVETDDSHVSRIVIPAGGEYEINPVAHRQIGERVGIPASYYDRMQKDAPALLDRNINHWFTSKPENRMVRVFDNGSRIARAFLSDKYRRIDNAEVAESILPIITGAGMDVESSEITDSRMYIKAFNPRVEGEVKVGDVVRSGFLIKNSEVGMGAYSVELMVMRLVCMNGMTTNIGQRRNHVGRRNVLGDDDNGSLELYRSETLAADDKALLMKLQDTIHAAMDATKFETVLQRLRETTENAVDNPIAAVKVLASRFELNETEHKSVLSYFAKGGDGAGITQYGLIQAVTRMSQDVASYDRATELEAVGGRIMELSGSEWSAIGSAN